MSSWGRLTESIHETVQELAPGLSAEKHIALVKQIEDSFERYMEEQKDMDVRLWHKLKQERLEAWQERNKFESLYLQAVRGD